MPFRSSGAPRPDRFHEPGQPLVRAGRGPAAGRRSLQVSWLSGRRIAPAFPELVQWHTGARNSPITVAGAAPDSAARECEITSPDSLVRLTPDDNDGCNLSPIDTSSQPDCTRRGTTCIAQTRFIYYMLYLGAGLPRRWCQRSNVRDMTNELVCVTVRSCPQAPAFTGTSEVALAGGHRVAKVCVCSLSAACTPSSPGPRCVCLRGGAGPLLRRETTRTGWLGGAHAPRGKMCPGGGQGRDTTRFETLRCSRRRGSVLVP